MLQFVSLKSEMISSPLLNLVLFLSCLFRKHQKDGNMESYPKTTTKELQYARKTREKIVIKESTESP